MTKFVVFLSPKVLVGIVVFVTFATGYQRPKLTETEIKVVSVKAQPSFKGVLQQSDILAMRKFNNETVFILEQLKPAILSVQRDYNIAKTVGSSASLLGVGLTAVGVVLAPFTGGISVWLTGIGLSTIALGTATTVTTVVIEEVKALEWIKQLKEILDKRDDKLCQIGNLLLENPTWKDYLKIPGEVAEVASPKLVYSVALGRITYYLAITKKELDLINLPHFPNPVGFPPQYVSSAMQHARTVGKVAIKAVKGLSGVISAGADIYTIVDAWTSNPQAVHQINKLLKHLNDKNRKLDELYQTFVSEELLEEVMEWICYFEVTHQVSIQVQIVDGKISLFVSKELQMTLTFSLIDFMYWRFGIWFGNNYYVSQTPCYPTFNFKEAVFFPNGTGWNSTSAESKCDMLN